MSSARRRFAGSTATLLPLLSILLAGCGRGGQPPRELPLGLPTAVKLAAEPTVYRVPLQAGEYLHVAVDQRGVDVEVSWVDSAGRRLLAVDSLNGAHGLEELFFVAERAGDYRLVLRRAGPGLPGGGGDCLVLAERRRAGDRDRLRAAACLALSTAEAPPVAPAAARAGYARALDLYRQSGETTEECLTEAKLGKALGGAETERAYAHLEHALALASQLGIDSNLPALHNELGLAAKALGRTDRARAAFAAAQASARRLGDRHEEAAAIQNLGLVEQDAGEPWQAILLFKQALDLWRAANDPAGEAATLHNLGVLYTVLGQLGEAEGSLDRALALYRAAGRSRSEAATVLARGWARFRAGDAKAAEADLSRSLELRRAVGDRPGEAVTLDRLGTLWRETGAFDRAIAEYRRALVVVDELGDLAGRARVLSNLGDALIRSGDARGGLRCEDEALAILSSRSEPSAEAYIRSRRARAEAALGDLDAAWRDIELAIPRLEGLRERAERGDFRLTFLDSVHDLFEQAVDLAMALDARRPGRGFDRRGLEMAERARARGLLDLVTDARGRRATWTDRLHPIDTALRAAEARLDEREVLRLLDRRETREVELRRAGGPPPVATRPLDAAAIQRQVFDPATVLLIYALGEARSHLWVVTDREIASAVLPPRAALEGAAARLHSLFARSTLAGTVRQRDLTATEVSRTLLGPAARQLAGRRIVVVPDGALALLPFGALPEPDAGAAAGPPLLAGHEVVVVPSASVLAAIRDRATHREPAPQLLAVVADPVFALDDPRIPGRSVVRSPLSTESRDVSRSAEAVGLRRLGRLQFAGEEGAALLALVRPADRFAATGFAASLSRLPMDLLGRFRYLHFATHAFLHPEHPELSGIVLSLYDEAGRPQPGFLRSYQLFALDLPADLIVLSACRTGLGTAHRGEGLLGLTQSCFHAGATRVVVSLWDVDDRSTAVLMERFYRELFRAGRTPAAALRVAQAAVRAEPRWAAPYYWAGFELQGEWR